MRAFRWKKLLGVTLAVLIVYFIAINMNINEKNIEPGKWTRVNETTIMLKGNIEAGNFDEFKKVFDDKVKTVIINSGGGDTYEAVQVGLVLKDANVDVIVRGYCLSSAANYLFTAGKTKTIEDGIVGFHGNTIAAVNSAGGADKLVEIPWHLKLLVDKDKYVERIEKTIILEKEFFNSLGISQKLFDITQTDDKGTGDGNTYEFLLPNSKTFDKYGIHNIKGEQSKKWINIFYEDAKERGRPDAKILVE